MWKPAVFSIAGGSVDCHDPSGRQFGNVYQRSSFDIVFSTSRNLSERTNLEAFSYAQGCSVLFIKTQVEGSLPCPSVKDGLNELGGELMT